MGATHTRAAVSEKISACCSTETEMPACAQSMTGAAASSVPRESRSLHADLSADPSWPEVVSSANKRQDPSSVIQARATVTPWSQNGGIRKGLQP